MDDLKTSRPLEAELRSLPSNLKGIDIPMKCYSPPNIQCHRRWYRLHTLVLLCPRKEAIMEVSESEPVLLREFGNFVGALNSGLTFMLSV